MHFMGNLMEELGENPYYFPPFSPFLAKNVEKMGKPA